jgi:hypothetical protein
MKGGVVLLELDYSVGIKQSDIWHHYSVQNVLILKTILVPFYTVEYSSPNKEQIPTVGRE